MKVSFFCDSEQTIGGGWSFQRNLEKGLAHLGVEVVNNSLEADVAFVASPSMVQRETVSSIKEKGLKLIVRLDNVPRNSRNRNTGTSRLKEFSQQADLVVWQSEWVRDYLIDFIQREGVVIYNGVDLEVFNPNGLVFTPPALKGCIPIYLYSRFNRDETKNWEVAWYEYQLIQRENPNAGLIIVGKFSPEQEEYNFDFFRGEKFVFIGIIDDSAYLANVYRGSDYLMATYYNDCFSNTYLEFLATKNNLSRLYKPNMTGGTPEMIDLWMKKGRDYFSLERMASDYKKVFEEALDK